MLQQKECLTEAIQIQSAAEKKKLIVTFCSSFNEKMLSSSD